MPGGNGGAGNDILFFCSFAKLHFLRSGLEGRHRNFVVVDNPDAVHGVFWENGLVDSLALWNGTTRGGHKAWKLRHDVAVCLIPDYRFVLRPSDSDSSRGTKTVVRWKLNNGGVLSSMIWPRVSVVVCQS